MSISRRRFVSGASALGLFGALLPELVSAQITPPPASTEDLPHSSSDFWHGFYDSVNPLSPNYGANAARAAKDQLADPAAETQYLHYNESAKMLRYATDIEKDELLDHDGDVSMSISLSQYRPGTGDSGISASQLRVDTAQIHPLANLLAPLAWTAIATLTPSKKTSKIPSLDQLGFHNPQATQASSNILLTQGAGIMAVNISKAAETSMFFKLLNVMVDAAKLGAPLLCLPAISTPAISTFSEVLADWEDRTRFVLNGNPTTAVATQQALANKEYPALHIGVVAGDYLMIPQRHVTELSAELPNLTLENGYLVQKDSDPKLNLPARAEKAVPGVTYATMRINVKPADNCRLPAGKSASA